MNKLTINDLAVTTNLDRNAMEDIRGGWYWFGFVYSPPSSTSDTSLKIDSVDGESQDKAHRETM